MFSPFFIEIKLECKEIKLNAVEDLLVKELKKEYKFNQIEILPGKIQLLDAFPIVKCIIERNTIQVATAVINQSIQPVFELINIITNVIKIDEYKLICTEAVGLFKVEDNTRIANFNFEEDLIQEMEIELNVVVKGKKIKMRFMHTGNKNNNYAAISFHSPLYCKSNKEDLTLNVQESIQFITTVIERYVSIQDLNITFGQIEVEAGATN